MHPLQTQGREIGDKGRDSKHCPETQCDWWGDWMPAEGQGLEKGLGLRFQVGALAIILLYKIKSLKMYHSLIMAQMG